MPVWFAIIYLLISYDLQLPLSFYLLISYDLQLPLFFYFLSNGNWRQSASFLEFWNYLLKGWNNWPYSIIIGTCVWNNCSWSKIRYIQIRVSIKIKMNYSNMLEVYLFEFLRSTYPHEAYFVRNLKWNINSNY